MANALYQTAVRELESFLPPRVVSQALHEGLATLGKTQDTLTLEDAITIVEKLILPRLSRAQGSNAAADAVENIIAGLRRVPVDTRTLSPEGQAQALELLRDALRPFNIYFEWSETQKLRAQLSLIESKHEDGLDATDLISAAQAQLSVLQQKLSDQLSLQARELAILEASLETSKALSSTKVRRLANLLDLIRSAQDAHQRVPAEIERAHKLASELRADKLQRLSDEERDLRALRETYSALADLEPALTKRLDDYEGLLRQETLLQDALPTLREELAQTAEALRVRLETEFSEQLTRSERPEEQQLLTLVLKILETALPPATDVQQLRDFARTRGGTELSEFHRLETEAAAFRDVPGPTTQALTAFVAQVRSALGKGLELPDMSEGWALVTQAQAEQAQNAESFMARLERVQAAAAPLLHLTSEDALSLRWRLQSLSMQIGAVHRVSPKRQSEIESNLQTTENLVHTLQAEATAARSVATQLIEDQMLDDVLGFLSPTAPPAQESSHASTVTPDTARDEALRSISSTVPRTPPNTTPAAGASILVTPALATPQTSVPLQSWLTRQAEHEGITGLALFTESADTLVAGTLPSDPKTLQRAVRLAKRRADTLGTALEQGAATNLTLETPESTLVALWLTRARSLVLVTRAPTWGGAARQHLEDSLPELLELLE